MACGLKKLVLSDSFYFSGSVRRTFALRMKLLVLVITATTTALTGGLFYAWSCSVTPGLARLADREYLAAMQAMNRAILNPVFFAAFLGTAVLLPLSTYLYYGPGLSTRFWLLGAASLVYLAGVMGVTGFGNVPLNEALDGFDLSSATVEAMAERRGAFEASWNRLNTIRTVASVLTIVLVISACLQPADD